MTTPDDPIDLDKLEAALAAATPGPWEADDYGMEVRTTGSPYGARAGSMKVADIRGWGHLTGRGGGCAFDEDKATAIQVANAALIVALRNAAPALVAELRRLRAAEDVLGEIVQRIDENPNEECPFCEPVQNDAGADHEPECPITAAHAALTREPAR